MSSPTHFPPDNPHVNFGRYFPRTATQVNERQRAATQAAVSAIKALLVTNEPKEPERTHGYPQIKFSSNVESENRKEPAPSERDSLIPKSQEQLRISQLTTHELLKEFNLRGKEQPKIYRAAMALRLKQEKEILEKNISSTLRIKRMVLSIFYGGEVRKLEKALSSINIRYKKDTKFNSIKKFEKTTPNEMTPQKQIPEALIRIAKKKNNKLLTEGKRLRLPKDFRSQPKALQFIPEFIEQILETHAVKDLDELKGLLKEMILAKNEDEDTINKLDFLKAIDPKRRIRYEVMNAPEYEALSKAATDGSWPDGEERAVTTRLIPKDCEEEFLELIDELFADQQAAEQIRQLISD